jgi:hypothetical protein
MPAKNTKCINIWNFWTPLDSAPCNIFRKFSFIFQFLIQIWKQVKFYTNWVSFCSTTEPDRYSGRTGRYTEPNWVNYWFDLEFEFIRFWVVPGWTGPVYRYRTAACPVGKRTCWALVWSHFELALLVVPPPQRRHFSVELFLKPILKWTFLNI